MRYLIIILIALLVLSPLPILAQDNTEQPVMSPIDQLKVETWQPTLGAVIQVLGQSAPNVNWEYFDRSLQYGVQFWTGWNACETMFGKESDMCSNGQTMPGDKFMGAMHDFMLSSAFTKLMLHVDDGRVAATFIDKMGVGRAESLLERISPVITTEFNPALGIEYQRWNKAHCHIRFWGDDFRKAPSGFMEYEDCLGHPFTIFVAETFCYGDTKSDLCISDTSWLYGFLSRRYLDGGRSLVGDWQELINRAAVHVGVEVPQK